MARTGRRPAPTPLKVVRGVKPSRINWDEPRPADAELVPPEGLPPAARAEWDRLAGDLKKRAGLSHWDAGVFGAYCSSVAKVAEAERLLATAGPLVKAPVFNRNGKRTGDRIGPNPAWRLWKDANELMLRSASMLGLSPADRSRIRTAPSDEPGEGLDPARLLSS